MEERSAQEIIEGLPQRPDEALRSYLECHKKELLAGEDDFSLPSAPSIMDKRFDVSVAVLCALIASGIEQGCMSCDNPNAMAKNIAYMLMGMKITARTIKPNPQDIDKQINRIMTNVLAPNLT